MMMRDYAHANSVSYLHAARWVSSQPPSKFTAVQANKAPIATGGGARNGKGGDQKNGTAVAEKGKRTSPVASLKKVFLNLL
jgi:hypothetical protein